MLRAVEQREKAIAAAHAAAKAQFPSPSSKEKLSKVIKKKEAEIHSLFRKERHRIQEELQEEKELTEKAAARAEIPWPGREGWTHWVNADGSHQETRKQLQEVEPDGWITAPGGHVGNNAQQSKHAAKNGSVYRLKAAKLDGGGPTQVFIANTMDPPEDLPEGWELAEDLESEDEDTKKTPDAKWPTMMATLIAPMGGSHMHGSHMQHTAHMHALTHHTSPHTMAGVSLAAVLEMEDAQRSGLAGKVQKGRKVTLTAIKEVFEAACGPEEHAASKGTMVGWLLAQLDEDLVATVQNIAE